jgi:Tfp pilus assembly protein PilX
MSKPGRAQRNGGAALFAALMMLVMMMLGAAALMRMIDAGTLLAGNLAFRRAATAAADAGSEAAIAWLQAQNGAALAADRPALGYYASDAPAGLLIDWNADNCGGGSACRKPAPAPAADAAGNTVRYLVQRMCRAAGEPQAPGNDCHVDSAGGSSSRGAFSYGANKRFAPSPAVYYRITARAAGPRNTVSVTEVLVRY